MTEQLNSEIKRWSRKTGVFPSENTINGLLGGGDDEHLREVVSRRDHQFM